MLSNLSRLAAVLFTLCALVFVVGCGSSSKSSDSGSSGAPMSKTEYRTKLTKIARQFQTEAVAAQSKASSASSEKEGLAAIGGVKSALQRFVDRLGALRPPKNVQSFQTVTLQKAKAGIKDIDDLVSAAKSKDKTKGKAALKALQQDLQGVSQQASTIDAKLK